MTDILMVQAAIEYARRGWHVFPCHIVKDNKCTCGEECSSPGKHPRTKNGLKDATTNEKQIQAWWKRWPDANIAIATGVKSGVFIVDIDGQTGFDSLEKLVKQHGELPLTLMVLTGKGVHYYFQYPTEGELGNSAGKLGECIDTRGTGGYVIVPPSIHPVRQERYQWQFEDEPPAKLPNYLFELLKKQAAPEPIPVAPNFQQGNTTRYIQKALEDAHSVVTRAGKGQRNDTLNKQAFAMGTLIGAGALDYKTAQDTLYHAAVSIGLGKAEAEKTIRSGLDSGLQHPRDLSNINQRTNKKPPGMHAGDNHEGNSSPDNNIPPDVDPETGEILTERLTRHNSYFLKHVEPDGMDKLTPTQIASNILSTFNIITDSNKNTYLYNGKFWEPLTEIQLTNLACKFDAKEHSKRARRTEIVDTLQNASLIKEIQWRALEGYEIPFLNGVLDFQKWQLREHRKEDYLETVLPVNFNEKAECKLWEQCLNDWFGEDEDYTEKVMLLRHFFGYILMPHADLKKALILQGLPDTGKSQVVGVIKILVGQQNTCVIPVDAMDDPRKLAPIKGKMVNLISELSSSALVKDGGFKQLVSTGDPIQVDEKYKAAHSYTPFCKHIIATNNLPNINDRSRATYNRLLVISFQNIIDEQKMNRNLLKDLTKELEGIALWAAIGAEQLFQMQGRWISLASSDTILEKHRRDQNDFYDFAAECLIEDETSDTPTSEIYKKYNEWKGGKQLSTVAIGMKASAAGFKIEPKRNPLFSSVIRCLIGYRLRY